MPTPYTDVEGTRLDMRLATNRIVNKSTRILTKSKNHDDESEELYKMPFKHQKRYYNKADPSPEHSVNDIAEEMSRTLDHKLK